MSNNNNEQHESELDEEQTGSGTPLNDESGDGATYGSGTAKDTHGQDAGYEGGALGSAGSGTQLENDNTGSNSGLKLGTTHVEEPNHPASGPGIDNEGRDYEGGALGSAGSGTGALDESEPAGE